LEIENWRKLVVGQSIERLDFRGLVSEVDNEGIGEATVGIGLKRTVGDAKVAILSEEEVGCRKKGPVEESDGAEGIVSLSTEEETTGGGEGSLSSVKGEGGRGERRSLWRVSGKDQLS
jgi:hypothetical protein